MLFSPPRRVDRCPMAPSKTANKQAAEEEIEVRAAAVQRINAAVLRPKALLMQAEMEAEMEARYGHDDPEAREAVRQEQGRELQLAMQEVDARLEEERRKLFGPESRRLLDAHETQLMQERDVIMGDHEEWTEKELERRRRHLEEVRHERLRAMRCRVEEATRAAMDKTEREERAQTVEELSRLEAEAREETRQAVRELEAGWEERQQQARDKLRQEMRQAQVERTARKLEGLRARKEEALAQVAADLERQVAEEQARARRDFWVAHADRLGGLQSQVEESVKGVREEAVDQGVRRALMAPLDALMAEVEGVRYEVLERMQRTGSYLAEEEYSAIIRGEPSIRDGQRRYTALVGKLVDVLTDLPLHSEPFKVTGKTVREILHEHDKGVEEAETAAAAASSSSSSSSVSYGRSEEEAGPHIIVDELTLDELLRAAVKATS